MSCVCLPVNKSLAEPMHNFDAVFTKIVSYRTGSVRIEIDDLGLKVKVTVTLLLFLHLQEIVFYTYIFSLVRLVYYCFQIQFESSPMQTHLNFTHV